MMAEMLQLPAIKRQAACVKKVYTQFNERQKQQQVQRSNGVQTDLRCGLIESEYPREHDHRQRGESY